MSIKKDLNKYTARDEQQNTLDYIKKIVEKKPDNKFFLLNLPTGVGKSYLSVMIADYFLSKSPDTKADVVTAGKILQDQYTQTFDYMNSLKGKDNYKCETYACSCEEGKEFSKLNKTKCDFCPYDIARTNFIEGQVSLTNFHLYLLSVIYGGDNGIMGSRKEKAKLLIIDECHLMDQVLSDFITIKVTESVIKKFKFPNEAEIINQLKTAKDMDSYVEFLKYFSNQINETITIIDESLSTPRQNFKNSAMKDKRMNKLASIIDVKTDDAVAMKLITELKQYCTKVDVFLTEYKEDNTNWVLENEYNEKTKSYELSLEPIWVHKYLEKYIWSRYDYVILMSGTILHKQLFSEINGINPLLSVYYSIASPFPEENRKIYYMPIDKMSFNKKEETFKKYIPVIKKLMKKYSNVKGVIHSNSFELAKWIQKDIEDDRLMFHESANKELMLKEFMESTEPKVIVSPSINTGVSFDHDLSRFQIIAKIPYPSLASKKNKQRQITKPEWYAYATVGVLMQSCGRSVRSKTDYADTIIIDASFGDVIRYSNSFFPKWFIDSVKTIKYK